jgi:hypothetical protein
MKRQKQKDGVSKQAFHKKERERQRERERERARERANK